METVLMIYGSSVLCVEIYRSFFYYEQLPNLEKEAVDTLKYVTGRYVFSYLGKR